MPVAAAVIGILAIVLIMSAGSGDARISVDCSPCMTRNATLYLMMDGGNGRVDSLDMSLTYLGNGKRIGPVPCTPEGNGSKGEGISCKAWTDLMKKPGTYRLDIFAWYGNRRKLVHSANITVRDSGLLPPNLAGKRIYRMGEPIPLRPMSGSSVSGISYSKSLRLMECDEGFITGMNRCLGECDDGDCRPCMESLERSYCEETVVNAGDGMEFAIVEYEGNPALDTEERRGPLSLLSLAFGTATRTSLYVSAMDGWDSEYLPAYPRILNGTVMTPGVGRMVFEIPEGERLEYLLGKRSRRGVAFFVIPVRKDEVLFAVSLSG